MALALPGLARAWGPEAHRAAAAVMVDRLCPAAQAELRAVLGDWTLEAAVVWPDRIRGEDRWAHTRDWHYMNIGDDVPVTPDAPVEGGRILAALREQLGRLEAGQVEPTERREALAFVLHLVVDLHQPLHVGRAADRGGNEIRVQFDGRETNLHQLWDGRLLRSAGLRTEDYARSLEPLALLGEAEWAAGTLEGWADESRRLRPWVYDFDHRRTVPGISRRYAETGRQLTAMRLAQAGVRSAYLLNRAWCPAE
nr:S1/P1 nuclease [Thioalkalivibrio sp. XN8]